MAKTVAAPPVAAFLQRGEACSADELLEDAARCGKANHQHLDSQWAAMVGVEAYLGRVVYRLAGEGADRARRTHARSRKHCDPEEAHTLTVAVDECGGGAIGRG